MTSKTYQEWSEAARKVDDSFGSNEWINQTSSPYYDEDLIVKIVKKLKKKRFAIKRSTDHSVSGLMDDFERLVLHCIQKNIGGIESEALYSHTYYYSKNIVEGYVNEVIDGLDLISDSLILNARDKSRILESVRKFMVEVHFACLVVAHLGTIIVSEQALDIYP